MASSDVAYAATVLVTDQFRVRRNETVVITADAESDERLVEALRFAAAGTGARPIVLQMPQLPYQGRLADPYIAEPVARAVAASDVWFDMTFPYLAGSTAHDEAMKAARTRYLLLGDLTAAGLCRLYGSIALDALFDVQSRLDDLVAASEGASCRITAASGTDVTFRMGKPGGRKRRYADVAGSSTVLGSCMFYPEPATVRGMVALDAIFHEYYSALPTPMRLEIDGDIRRVHPVRDHELLTERALRRAANGEYGQVIHLTCGFHPAARYRGQSFIEDIRTIGTNAIGLGVPWWESGGGENHPDGVITRQSLWIDGTPVVQDGAIVGPPELAEAARALQRAASP
jgi:hypothetical protein